MSATTSVHDRPAIEEMYIVHRAFRTQLPQVARFIRDARAGDGRRASIVAGHLRVVLLGLELHHTGEDAELWPRLLERARPSAELIETMQAQHETVHALIEQVRSLAGTWQTTPAAVTAEQLARAVEFLCASLFAHLELEEREVLPLVLEHITQAEWSRLGNSGKHSIRPADAAVVIGGLLAVCTEDERRLMLSALPAWARIFAVSLGGLLYRRHLRRLHAA